MYNYSDNPNLSIKHNCSYLRQLLHEDYYNNYMATAIDNTKHVLLTEISSAVSPFSSSDGERISLSTWQSLLHKKRATRNSSGT